MINIRALVEEMARDRRGDINYNRLVDIVAQAERLLLLHFEDKYTGLTEKDRKNEK